MLATIGASSSELMLPWRLIVPPSTSVVKLNAGVPWANLSRIRHRMPARGAPPRRRFVRVRDPAHMRHVTETPLLAADS